VLAEVVRARGRPALAARHLTPFARKRVAELCPDPIRSDTSRHGIVPALGGEPSTAGHPAEAERQSPTIPPHKPNPVNKHETVGLRGLRTVHFRETGGLNERHPSAYADRARSSRASIGLLTHPLPGQGPPLPNLREEIRNPPHPRCLPSVNYHRNTAKLSLGSLLRVGHFHKLSPACGKRSAPPSDYSMTRQS